MTVSIPTTRLSSVITGCGGNETTCSRRSSSGLTRSTNGTISGSPGGSVRAARPSRSTIPARACGTIRTPAAATMNRNTARTISAIRPAVIAVSSFRDERRGAPDLDDLDPLAGLDDVVVVVRAGGPHLAVDAHAADTLVVGDALHHHPGPPHQRRRAGAQPRRLAAVRAGQRPQAGEQDQRHHEEHGPAERRAGAGGAGQRRDERTARERGEEEAERGDLSDTEDDRRDQPDQPGIHVCYLSEARATGKLKYCSG